MKKLLFSLAFLSLTSLGFAQKKMAYAAVLSVVKDAKEKGNVKLVDSLIQDYINNGNARENENYLDNPEESNC